MRDRVDDDVRQVMVDQPIEDLATRPFTGDHARRLEDFQMLAHQRLWYAERVDQFVHAALRLAQLQHDGDAHRCGQGAQQLAGGLENFPRRRGRTCREPALVLTHQRGRRHGGAVGDR